MSLQSLIQQHRAALLARDRAAAQEMTRYYDAIWRRIYTRLNELLAKMQDAQNAGKDIKVSWLYEQDRLQTLLPQVAQQFNTFAQQAQIETRNLSTLALHIGTQDAQSLLSRAFENDAGINITFNRLPQEAIRDMVGSFSDGSPVAKLFAGFGEDAAQTVKNALISGVALGKNPRIIAKEVQSALSVPLSRALVISRTESIRAYRSANLETYRANSDVVDMWIWSADLSARTCAMCIAMNGTEHPLSEEFASHPQCRCAPVPKTKSWSDLGYAGIPDTNLGIQDGEEWFSKQSEATQRAILGTKAGYEAYKRGDVSLSDFVGHASDPEWGKSRYQKSAKQLGIAS